MQIMITQSGCPLGNKFTETDVQAFRFFFLIVENYACGALYSKCQFEKNDLEINGLIMSNANKVCTLLQNTDKFVVP